MNDKLNQDSKERKEMIDDALETIANYSETMLKKEKTLQQYKIEEIKYITSIKELNEYIEIYKTKLEKLEKDNTAQEKELLNLRKKTLKDQTDLSTLKSIIELLINKYGIEEVSAVTKIDQEKLNGYIE